MTRKMLMSLLGTAALSLAACVGGMATTDPTNDPNANVDNGEQLASGGEDNTFDHDFNDTRDPFDILQQKQTEGNPLVATRLHSCQKMQYSTLGNLLTSRGVNLGMTQQGLPSAGQLYKSGGQALGAPNYLGRVREPTQNTTAGVTKLMDVFVQAAPEVIANMPNMDACKVNGQSTNMFNQDGTCNPDAISCLIGAPASQQWVQLCNQEIKDASSPDIGQKMAVATILAAAHTCE